MKTCRKCGASKPLDDFANRPKSRDGKRAQCRECMNQYFKEWEKSTGNSRERSKRWKAANSDKIRAGDRKRRAENPDKFREKYRRQYARNADKRAAAAQARRDRDRDAYNARVRQRRAANPAIHRAAYHKRRVKLRSLECSATTRDVNSQLQQQGCRCYYCLVPLGLIGYEVDHFHPVSKNGTHTKDNIVMTCSACNRSKNDCEPYTFMKKIGIKFSPYPRCA